MQRGNAAFDPEAILVELKRHKVDFVVIGAYAAVTQGWPEPTGDVDITPDRDCGTCNGSPARSPRWTRAC